MLTTTGAARLHRLALAAIRPGLPWVWPALSTALLLLAAAELYRSLHDARSHMACFFNSDVLYPASLYRELVTDGGSYWDFRFPKAPFWFPDVGLYFLCRAAAGGLGGSMFAYAAAQFALVLGAAWWAVRHAVPAESRPPARVLLAAAAAWQLAECSRTMGHAYHLMMPFQTQLHVGALICTLAGVGLVTRILYPAPRRRTWHAPALVALTWAGVASDRILFMWLLLPAACCLAPLALRPFRPAGGLRALLAASAALAAGAACGHLTYKAAAPNEVGMGSYVQFSFDNVPASAACVARRFGDLFRDRDPAVMAMALIGPACLIQSAAAVLRPGGDSGPRRFLAAFYLVMTAGCAAAMLLSRIPQHFGDFQKFILPAWLMPLYCCGAAAGLLGCRPAVRAAASVLALGLAAHAVHAARGEYRGRDHGVWHYHPPHTARLDQLAEKYGLRSGMSDHWSAAVQSLTSRRGLEVATVIFDGVGNRFGLTHQHHLRGLARALGREGRQYRADFDFFLYNPRAPESRGAPEKLVKAFGEPAAREPVLDMELWVYNRPGDHLFRNALRYDYPGVNRLATGAVGEAIIYPGASLSWGAGVSDEGDDRCAREGRTPPTCMAFGPYLEGEPGGTYRLEICYSGTRDGAGHWETQINRPGRGEENTPRGGLPAGTRLTASAAVRIPEDEPPGASLSVRMNYAGVGDLTLHSLRITRVE